MPTWEEHIRMDENGGLTMRNTYTGESRSGFSLVVPKNSATGLNYADLGIKAKGNGEWEIAYDKSYPGSARGIEKTPRKNL